MRNLFVVICSLLILTACSNGRYARVTPESLLNSSSEKISIKLSGDSSIDQLKMWIDDDMPSSAVLSCESDDGLCRKAQRVLNEASVSYELDDADTGSVVLSYDRAVALECSSASSLGCSVSVNSLNMVGDYQQYINPELSDPQDAAKAVDSYGGYMSGK